MKCMCPKCGHEFESVSLIDTALGRARSAKGMSREKVTKAIGGGLSVRQLTRLENGQTMPELLIARKLSALYGKPVDELWPPIDDPEVLPAEASSVDTPGTIVEPELE